MSAQAVMSNVPPNGVKIAMLLKLKPVKLFVASPKIDHENKITPIINNQSNTVLDLDVFTLNNHKKTKSNA